MHALTNDKMVSEHGEDKTLSVRHFGSVVSKESRHAPQGLAGRQRNTETKLWANELCPSVVAKGQDPRHGVFEVVEVYVRTTAGPNARCDREECTAKVHVFPLAKLIA